MEITMSEIMVMKEPMTICKTVLALEFSKGLHSSFGREERADHWR
jgi:hypothetical protein